MRAKIVKINPKTIVIKNEKGDFATVTKNKLDFNYQLGDIITIERNGDELYFLPEPTVAFQSDVDFWGNEPPIKTETRNYDTEWNKEKSLVCAIAILGLAVIGMFFIYRICLYISIILFVYAIATFSETSHSKKSLTTLLLAMGVILWILEIALATGYGI